MDTALADPLVGTLLDGRYRVDAPIAHGGMSTVYAGTDTRLDRRIAIKVMAQGLVNDQAFLERFGREARAAARLSHVNVVAVHDQGTTRVPGIAGPIVFLVMELVRGRTVRDLLRERGRLSPDEATSLLEPVLAALAAAHRAGLVHRDIKPENVLISDEGAVKVADFGLARAVTAPTTSTAAGVLLGTIAYVSPEQISSGAADPRSDVYSAGILLYELLVGAPPYTGDSAVAIAYRHVNDDVPPPSADAPGIPRGLDDLVVRATRREPGARPADAGQFLAQLLHTRTTDGLRRTPVAASMAAPADPRPPMYRSGPPTGATRTVSSPAPMGAPPPTGRRYTSVLPPEQRRTGSTPTPPPSSVRRIPPPTRWPNERRAHRRRFVVGLLCVGLLGAAAVLAGWWFGSAKLVDVPPLANVSQQQAKRNLETAGLRISIGTPESDENVPAGRVIRSDPGAGDRVERGTVVTVVVSTGRPRATVPRVVGRDDGDAKDALEKAGLKVQSTSEFNAEVEKGHVIRQTPAGGTTVDRSTTVQIVVSKGAKMVRVPSVLFKDEDDARSILEKAGFKVKSVDRPGLTGRVISQSPGPLLKKFPQGSTVTIVIA